MSVCLLNNHSIELVPCPGTAKALSRNAEKKLANTSEPSDAPSPDALETQVPTATSFPADRPSKNEETTARGDTVIGDIVRAGLWSYSPFIPISERLLDISDGQAA